MKILKTGCYLEFGCCDELLPYSECEEECFYREKKSCGCWIKKGTIINKNSVKTHCGDSDLFSIIDRNRTECILTGVINEGE